MTSNHLLIGGAGAVGRRLLRALTARGNRVVVADFTKERLPDDYFVNKHIDQQGLILKQVYGVDVRDRSAVFDAMEQASAFVNSPEVTVWNLAAPLSVETARNPEVAKAVTVEGMKNILSCMSQMNKITDATRFSKLMFTDSIGSFGHLAPRKNATARWLIKNPEQDPGSDYGRQKRACRILMDSHTDIDTRFAVLPGVLHAEEKWGAGTTEYALDAVKHAVVNYDPSVKNPTPFICPVDLTVTMPMVYSEDLMRGLMLLADADGSRLKEPQHGYCLPGVSFNAKTLFKSIRKIYPEFDWKVELHETMDECSRLWPDTLSMKEAKRDLGYVPKVKLDQIVEELVEAHQKRLRGNGM